MSVPTIPKWSNTMADIIEKIEDIVDEEDKGDVRTATQSVEISDTSAVNTVTIEDLVSVEEVVSVLVSTDGESYDSLYNAGDAASEIVGAQLVSSDPISDNKVDLDYIGTDDGTDAANFLVNLSSGVSQDVSGSATVTHVKVVARGY